MRIAADLASETGRLAVVVLPQFKAVPGGSSPDAPGAAREQARIGRVCAIAFSVTVASTITRFRLALLITFARFAASFVSASGSSTPASPNRLRWRVGSTGGFACKYV